MITVACVFWGNKFSVDYVYKLKAMVERNTTVEHRFVCLTDRTIPNVICRPILPGQEGWWNKMQLFDPRHMLGYRVVYFDLDTIITGNIDWLLQYQGSFMGIEDVGAVNAHQPYLKNKLQSGVLAFDARANDHIWTSFMMQSDIIYEKYRGDGEYLNDTVTRRDLLQHLHPGKLKSYKYQVYPNNIGDASIVCFHGRPSIVQAINETIITPMATYEPQQWIKDYWRN